MTPSLAEALAALPLAAILRGLTPDEAPEIGKVLVEAGFRILEVPLNSPEPFLSIERMVGQFGNQAIVGAGTVRRVEDVARLADIGARIVIMPHADTEVIAAAKRAGLLCVPGIFTATEAFAAIDAGADALKLFPAEAAPPPVLKALKAVLPRDLAVMPVGSITPDSLAGYWAAGARGFGLGSALYKPGLTATEVAVNAGRFVAAVKALA